jgi:NAD(P)-dependent dehydrogenase (short-subunit alcohol dehydrogenase family)
MHVTSGVHRAARRRSFKLELSEFAAREAPFGIKVIIVEPGALRTNFSADSALKLMSAMDAYQDILGSMRALVHDMHGRPGWQSGQGSAPA